MVPHLHSSFIVYDFWLPFEGSHKYGISSALPYPWLLSVNNQIAESTHGNIKAETNSMLGAVYDMDMCVWYVLWYEGVVFWVKREGFLSLVMGVWSVVRLDCRTFTDCAPTRKGPVVVGSATVPYQVITPSPPHLQFTPDTMPSSKQMVLFSLPPPLLPSFLYLVSNTIYSIVWVLFKKTPVIKV